MGYRLARQLAATGATPLPPRAALPHNIALVGRTKNEWWREPRSVLITRLPARRALDQRIVMSAAGVVSRVSPVQTALRNCTRDEGGPFEFGNQVLISSHRKPLSSKAMVVNVAETLGHDLSRHGRERRAQANRCRSVESGLGDVKTGGSPALRDQLGGCPDSDRAASGVQAARSSTRLLCGT